MKATRSLLYLGVASGAMAVTGQLGDAPTIYNNPPYASYTANLGTSNPLGITGSVTASTDQGGAVIFNIAFSNLPTTGGPFLYHIHVDPVPANGNCTAAGAHLDPYLRGETPPCDPTQPQTCQVGDLSGKHGTINGTSFVTSYIDPYVDLIPGTSAFLGNRSFVLHYANKTRIACANFVSVGRAYVAPGAANSTTTSSAVPGPTSSAAAAPAVVGMPNAPGYAGGGSWQNVSAPSTSNTNVLANNGLTANGQNGGSSSSNSNIVMSNDAAGGLVARKGAALVLGLAAAMAALL